MDHARRVRRVKGRGDLPDEASHLVRGQWPALGDDLAKRLARHELHDHERVRAVAAFVEHHNDVRMDDRRRAARLIGETRAEGIVRVGPEELYRDIAIQLLAALVDPLDESIALGEQSRRGGRTKVGALFAGHLIACPQLVC